MLTFALAGCGTTQLPLTPAEEAQLQTLSNQLGSTVSLQYDREAVTHQRPNGTVVISVYQTAETVRDVSFCRADSFVLQRQSAATAAALVPALRFARYHNRMVILYEAATPMRNGSSTGLCSRAVSASMRTKRLVFRNHHGSI